MQLLSLTPSRMAVLVLGLSIQLARGMIVQLTVQEFDTVVQSKLYELNGLRETLNDIIEMVTQTATFGPGAVGTARWPSLETMIVNSDAYITNAGAQTADGAPGSDTIANELAAAVRNIPNIQVTLHRDTWGDREGQPYAQNIWTRIKEFFDYLTNSGMINVERASSLLSWLYDADFDPIVGIYTLDTDKKDILQVAAGTVSLELEQYATKMMDLETLLQRGSDPITQFVADYSGVFNNLKTVIGDIEAEYNPRGLASLAARLQGPVLVNYGNFGL
ncbi:hypothetical protein TWF506_000131 [Arthrobotrys conoides]|uniref:Uncharacterized protein n=1 Tax=Arthrobotrys conoides TaxID=74498 RepID=A0AAN8NZ90_9PEZI